MFRTRNERKIIIVLTVLTAVIASPFEDHLLESHPTTTENSTCDKVQASEFPEDLFTKNQRRYGAFILHVIFAAYCFATIAVICSERFLPSVTCISEDLKLSPDVTAATFMSIATSAPELFSNIIGTFITNSSIGIGHVIGNGYFNMFFVAALGGIAAKQEIVLEWWPLTRDCAIYALVALTLTGIVWDGIVQTYETLVLLSLYVVYFIIMFNNETIMIFMRRKFGLKMNATENETAENNDDVTENLEEKHDPKEAEALDSGGNDFTLPPLSTPPVPKAKNDRWNISKKILSMPISLLIRYTIPNVRTAKFRSYYPVAFLICVAWIALLTYLGAWMASVIGDTLGISDLVMGMVVMAAGGSVVEAYCVYWKAKRGECNIGLSNCLGCNNLDATLCLALPWFIKTLPIRISGCDAGASNVTLESSLIYVNCSLLVISVLALLMIFYLNKFKLDKKSGLVCGILYVIVLYVGISVESHAKND